MRPLPDFHPIRKRQRGAALLIILTIIGIGVAVLLVNALTRAANRIEADKKTAAALAQAKDALIGYAVTYRDTHAGNVFGYLPCPDVNNDGAADAIQGDTYCAGKDIPVVGRLPWKTLGLPPLRDGHGECLWYAVSGTFKAVAGVNLTDFMNWDTLGQFTIQDTGGSTVAGAAAHDRPIAVIFSPGPPLNTQNRPPSSGQECSGDTNNSVAAYLDGSNAFSPPPSPPATPIALTMGSASNNDALLWITPGEIFKGIKQRSDFKSDVDTVMIDLRDCLDSLPTASLPAASVGNKGINSVLLTISACLPPTGTTRRNVLNNWKENLLYAKLPTPTKITMDGALTANACTAVLAFGGERTTRTVVPLTAQTRTTAAEKGNATTFGDPAMYLEGANASAFPTGISYSGASKFSSANPSQDMLACITGKLPGTTLVSFASSFGSFVTTGSGVTADSTNKALSLAFAGGGSGGCFWYPTTIPLNGKTLRAYYDFAFTNADPIGGGDNGNGFTLSFLRGDAGSPVGSCGTQADMGVLDASTLLGFISLFVETDVHQDSANNDPAGNHTAIMYSGNLAHSAVASGNGYTTSACDGTAQGCLHSPANNFEESPTPLTHNQRIEIYTGYSDNTCASAGGSYAKITVWVDCAFCNDTSADFSAKPTASRCLALPTEMNSIYFGFTGGFTGGANPQGVTLQNLNLRTE